MVQPAKQINVKEGGRGMRNDKIDRYQRSGHIKTLITI